MAMVDERVSWAAPPLPIGCVCNVRLAELCAQFKLSAASEGEEWRDASDRPWCGRCFHNDLCHGVRHEG